METKECGFSGFKMNGFLALFLHLVVLTAVIIFGFIISVPTLILSVCLCLIWFIMFAGEGFSEDVEVFEGFFL